MRSFFGHNNAVFLAMYAPCCDCPFHIHGCSNTNTQCGISLHANTGKGTKMQTLGELRMRDTANIDGWARLLVVSRR